MNSELPERTAIYTRRNGAQGRHKEKQLDALVAQCCCGVKLVCLTSYFDPAKRCVGAARRIANARSMRERETITLLKLRRPVTAHPAKPRPAVIGPNAIAIVGGYSACPNTTSPGSTASRPGSGPGACGYAEWVQIRSGFVAAGRSHSERPSGNRRQNAEAVEVTKL